MQSSISDYLKSVEFFFEEIFLIPFSWIDIDDAVVAGARDAGWTSEQFAMWLGKEHDLRASIPEERPVEDPADCF